MRSLVKFVLLLHFNIVFSINNSALVSDSLLSRLKEYTMEDDFTWLLVEVGIKLREHLNCLAIISDGLYNDAFTKDVFNVFQKIPIFKILVKEYEDLLSPNYKTLTAIQQARDNGCNAYIILIANGDQVSRFLRFGDRHRVLDTRAKFVILYDSRLFKKELHYLWKKIINIIFIRKYADSKRFEFSTVPFPGHMTSVYLTKRVDTWRAGKFQYNNDLFIDKTSNLRDEVLRVATFEHMPSVVKVPSKAAAIEDYLVIGSDDHPLKYDGLEIQILHSLSKAMNFEAIVYEPIAAETEAWGRKQLNGSFSGLLGEVTTGKADVVLGNFLYTPYNLQLLDLSRPYITQCFTFLTPESSTDNSWKTLILPFKLYMWIAIFLTLLICTFIFFGLSQFQHFLNGNDSEIANSPKNSFWKDLFILWHYKKAKNAWQTTGPLVVHHNEGGSEGLYLFDTIDYSLLNAYSMLLLVSLPKMPSGWSLRMMTGWWWIYCLLVTVAYRASMTAILANPAQKVTIDSLEELATSNIECGGWGEQNKEFFTTSLDTAGQKVGKKFEIMYDANEAIAKVAGGEFAYYENIYFLHNAKVKEKLTQMAMKSSSLENSTEIVQIRDKDLHIMGDCVINMPISLGLQKNSPLKPKVDVFLQRVIEAGLVKKWLRDVMIETTVAEAPLNKVEVKALMDVKKFYGALVALLSGYLLSILVLAGENIYWYKIVLKNPLFDKYSKDPFYVSNKRI